MPILDDQDIIKSLHFFVSDFRKHAIYDSPVPQFFPVKTQLTFVQLVLFILGLSKVSYLENIHEDLVVFILRKKGNDIVRCELLFDSFHFYPVIVVYIAEEGVLQPVNHKFVGFMQALKEQIFVSLTEDQSWVQAFVLWYIIEMIFVGNPSRFFV